MIEYGIFNDDSADYSSQEAVESGFYSVEEAEKAIEERYSDEDFLTVHCIEEPDDDEDEDEPTPEVLRQLRQDLRDLERLTRKLNDPRVCDREKRAYAVIVWRLRAAVDAVKD